MGSGAMAIIKIGLMIATGDTFVMVGVAIVRCITAYPVVSVFSLTFLQTHHPHIQHVK